MLEEAGERLQGVGVVIGGKNDYKGTGGNFGGARNGTYLV